jgi:hypothetical protein
MNPGTAQDEEILSRLDRFNALLFSRDPAVVDELWNVLGFCLIGSELRESAATREELAAIMADLFSRPCRLSWAWNNRTVTRAGEFAWVCVDCDLTMTFPDQVETTPYRMVCIFQRVGGRWQWRLYSGSEPQ